MRKIKVLLFLIVLLCLGVPALIGILCASAIQGLGCWAFDIDRRYTFGSR